VKSTGHTKYRFAFDAAIGDYTARSRYTQDCFNLTTDEVIVEDAYKARSYITVEVLQAVKTDDGDVYATEMSGVLRDRFELSPGRRGFGQLRGFRDFYRRHASCANPSAHWRDG